MSATVQESAQRLIINHLDSQRAGSRLRIHLEDLFIAVPEENFDELKAAGSYGTQLIDVSKLNSWLKDNGYRLIKTLKVEHDERGSWAVLEKIE